MSKILQKKACSCNGKDCDAFSSQTGQMCRVKILSSLSEISKYVVESENLSDTLALLLKVMKEDMGVKRGMVNLFNSRNGKIFIHDSIGLTKEEENRGVYSIGEGITGKVVQSGEQIIVPVISKEPNFLNRTRSRTSSSDAELSFVCIPILKGKKVLGAISVERVCDDHGMLDYDVQILGVIAAMIAQAVELYLLEHEDKYSLKLENERLRDALKEKFHPSNIIGNSKPMLEVYSLINKIVKTR